MNPVQIEERDTKTFFKNVNLRKTWNYIVKFPNNLYETIELQNQRIQELEKQLTDNNTV